MAVLLTVAVTEYSPRPRNFNYDPETRQVYRVYISDHCNHIVQATILSLPWQHRPLAYMVVHNGLISPRE